MLYNYIVILIQFLLIFSAACCSITRNSLYSVLFLICVFINAAILLLLFEIDFLGIIFIMIYVGAIAVLFLFIVMLLDLKEKSSITSASAFFVSFILGFIFSLNIKLEYLNNLKLSYYLFDNNSLIYENFLFNYVIDNFTQVQLIGQVMYNYYLLPFFMAGFVLLLPIVIVVTLTLENKMHKTEMVSRKLARSHILLSLFPNK
jgi:NADH:ubiquinone oxidoreductase subunit 6 (subunit J)